MAVSVIVIVVHNFKVVAIDTNEERVVVSTIKQTH